MHNQKNIIILVPVYNDWHSFSILLQKIESTLVKLNRKALILAVDDSSTTPFSSIDFNKEEFRYLIGLEILHLIVNLGHQRAIAIGLSYIKDNYPLFPIIVMDADGEDRPEDIGLLLSCHERMINKIIFAKRIKRSENFWFRLFYVFYRGLFFLLTGKKISFGNFSLIPALMLPKIVHMAGIWNHFAGAILKSGLPIFEAPTIRGKRYSGKATMNFSKLVLHGMSAISVYLEIVTVRLLVGGAVIIMFGFLGIIAIIYIRFFTALAIPGWATNLTIGIAVLIFQAILLITLLNFIVLNLRSSKQLIPILDYHDYCDKREKVF